jgi:hypothetical protein
MSRKYLSVVVINVLLIALILYAFEFIVSPKDELPVNGRLNGEEFTWGHRVENNKLGFREREIELAKPAHTYRVIVLGDSLTWGVGLAPESRYTAVTEMLLNNTADNITFEVLNFGIIGAPTVLERDTLREVKDVVKPDLIVVGFCLNDPQPESQDYSVEREALSNSAAGRIVKFFSRLLRSAGLTHSGRKMKEAFYVSAEKNGRIPVWQTALQRSYEPGSKDWEAFVQALEDIKAVSDELGLPAPVFTILNQGTYTDRPTNYRDPDEALELYLRWYHQAEEAAREIGFTTYHHEEEIAGQLNDESLAVNILDGHPSANLNRIYADKLYDKILRTVRNP